MLAHHEKESRKNPQGKLLLISRDIVTCPVPLPFGYCSFPYTVVWLTFFGFVLLLLRSFNLTMQLICFFPTVSKQRTFGEGESTCVRLNE